VVPILEQSLNSLLRKSADLGCDQSVSVLNALKVVELVYIWLAEEVEAELSCDGQDENRGVLGSMNCIQERCGMGLMAKKELKSIWGCSLSRFDIL